MQLPSPLTRKRARIEVIPLIDIVFFLLATFVMVSLSMVNYRGIAVNLPEAQTAIAGTPHEDDIILSISADGQLYWNKNPLPVESLAQRFTALKKSMPEARIVINGDSEARFGAALTVLDAARKSGLTRIQFQTRAIPGHLPGGSQP